MRLTLALSAQAKFMTVATLLGASLLFGCGAGGDEDSPTPAGGTSFASDLVGTYMGDAVVNGVPSTDAMVTVSAVDDTTVKISGDGFDLQETLIGSDGNYTSGPSATNTVEFDATSEPYTLDLVDATGNTFSGERM